MTDSSCLSSIIYKVRPSEVYNLAAQSHVKVSFEVAEYTADVDAMGTLRLLEAIRSAGLTKTRFYQVPLAAHVVFVLSHFASPLFVSCRVVSCCVVGLYERALR